MSPQPQSAQVYVKNETGGTAFIRLSHMNSTNGTQSGAWAAAPDAIVGPLTVNFETGIGVGGVGDYWWIEVSVSDGPNPGIYASSGSATSGWKECQLQSDDGGKDINMTVSTTQFTTNLPSGSCQTSMTKLGPYTGVTNVFVLMLENHSFDNIFAFSGIPDIVAVTTSNSNSYNGKTYSVSKGAPSNMPTDPGHEFEDVYQQLTGTSLTINNGKPSAPVNPYPAVNNSGFETNYATSTSENPEPPTAQQIGDIMQCFDTPNQLPVIYQLATEFAICDHWFSSLPGPTWPNRFFLHGASSSGMYNSPSTSQMKKWESREGFTYPNGSIFDLLKKYGYSYRLYNDTSGPFSGSFPQVASLKGIEVWDSNPVSFFKSDLQGPYPYLYTFIEPNYGDASGNNYTGGSSQHPMDGVTGGEQLIKMVYEAIRNSLVWQTSLLIIAYDEHGGFYDSVPPPDDAQPPDDGSSNDIGFTFSNLGVRVPAVVISPRIRKGTVDQKVYDHTSVLATLERNFSMPPLTQRDKAANDVLDLLTLSDPRTDCPVRLNDPATTGDADKVATAASTIAAANAGDAPLPTSGNFPGFLGVAVKADLAMAGDDPQAIAQVQDQVNAIKTSADAQAYMEAVMAKVNALRADQ